LQVIYVGEGDFHDIHCDATEEVIHLTLQNSPETSSILSNQTTHCLYSVHVYSSSLYGSMSRSNDTKAFIIVICCVVFLFTVSFTMYDKVVDKRDVTILNAALRANQVVSSVFPSHIRDKLLAEQENSERDNRSVGSHMIFTDGTGRRQRRESFAFSESGTSFGMECSDDDELTVLFSSKPPIADLFPETTILFADIAGFTNWSSAREPTQVFTLLGKFINTCTLGK
jgi:hypothetical protein